MMQMPLGERVVKATLLRISQKCNLQDTSEPSEHRNQGPTLSLSALYYPWQREVTFRMITLEAA